ncbi:MAG: DNA-3-methyladenine glycosylase [Fuerstiella sp.]
MNNQAIDLSFYDHDVADVARALLGKVLHRRTREGLTSGRIVETEAYLATNDSASHSFNGINRKNASMFGHPGRAYVYTIHARQCFNVVTESRGVASAVLIRAVKPLTGLHLMERRRGTDRQRDLCRGPARLCEAFEIGRDLDGWDLTRGRRLWIGHDSESAASEISTSVRIGVTSAHDHQLRFFVPGSPFVSGPRRMNL